jgi:hypothetical protein
MDVRIDARRLSMIIDRFRLEAPRGIIASIKDVTITPYLSHVLAYSIVQINVSLSNDVIHVRW